MIFFGIIKRDFDRFILIIFGRLFVVLIIFGIFFENIFATITIDGNNKLLSIKRTKICYCLKNIESYNLDDIVNITFQLNNSVYWKNNENYDSFDIIFNLPGGKSINEINKVDKDGEKQRVYNTLRRIIP